MIHSTKVVHKLLLRKYEFKTLKMFFATIIKKHYCEVTPYIGQLQNFHGVGSKDPNSTKIRNPIIK